MTPKSDPYAELRELPLDQRIEAVLEDVRPRRDRFRCDDTHGLAELLSLDASMPNGSWGRTNVVKPVELAEVAEYSDSIEECWVYDLQEHVSSEHFQELEAEAERARAGEFDVSILNEFEKAFITGKVLEERIGSEGGYILLAHAVVEGESGESLAFEALIEDDGTCVQLLWPYDERDGRFQTLEGCGTEDF